MSKKKDDAKDKKKTAKKKKTEKVEAPETATGDIPSEAPFTIHAQYVRDASFENPHALAALRPGQQMPEMDINIGMDARKVTDVGIDDFYEVVLNVKAEAKRGEEVVFIAELQYGMAVSVGQNVPENNHHPLLLIEIPRMAFPYARQILSDMTTQGGFPPLLLNPVDFHALYMQRFAKDIEESQKQAKN